MTDFGDLKEEFVACEKEYAIARQEYNDALEALQSACEHATIVGGNEEFRDVDWRVCVTCGLYEVRGYNNDGDEYDYATRAPFKVLRVYHSGGHWIDGVLRKDIVGTKAYSPMDGSELRKFFRGKK